MRVMQKKPNFQVKGLYNNKMLTPLRRFQELYTKLPTSHYSIYNFLTIYKRHIPHLSHSVSFVLGLMCVF
jgi:hypothetical protein